MNPREGPPPFRAAIILPHSVIRQGIPYGEALAIGISVDSSCTACSWLFYEPHLGIEVTDEERNTRHTTEDRGLLFVCYQSELSRGFQFLQEVRSVFNLSYDNS